MGSLIEAVNNDKYLSYRTLQACYCVYHMHTARNQCRYHQSQTNSLLFLQV